MKPKMILAHHIPNYVAQGWRIESQSDVLAVFVKGRRVNHVLHLILSLLTLGMWLVVGSSCGSSIAKFA